MNKKITLIALVLATSFATKAQMKIGGPPGAPAASAILDLSNTAGGNKGFLAPQVVLTATNVAAPVTSPAAGLIVYNTTASGGSTATDVKVGYYYWSTTLAQWVSFSNSSVNINDLRAVGTNGHITQDAGAGSNGTGIGTGTDDIAIGNGAMNGITSGQFNVGIGTNALAAIGTGTRSVAIGWNALAAATVSNNTAVGYRALLNTTTGSANVGIGNSILAANTTGSSNVAAGFSALGGNTSGSDNIGVGSNALNSNLIGTRNVAIGSSSLTNNTSDQNTAVGHITLTANTTGGANTAIGSRALSANTTASANTAIGQIALLSTTTGGENTAVGQYNMVANTTGSQNTSVGSNTLQSNNAGADNTAIGYRALQTMTTGNNNTGLGHLAGSALTTGGNNTAIGANTDLASATASNQLNIGNNIFGTGLTGTVAAPAGNIGIGTAAPSTNLEILNNGAGGTAVTLANVANTALKLTGNGNGQSIIQNFSAKDASGAAKNAIIGVNPNYNGNGILYIGRTGSNDIIMDLVSGNLGIGTGTPNAPLQLGNGQSNRKIVLYETGNNDHQFYGLGINNNTLRYQTDLPSSDHVFFAATSATTSNELMRIKGNGNVGIGTAAPLTTLAVNGSLGLTQSLVALGVNYNVSPTDCVISIKGAAGGVTVFLPDITAANVGRVIYLSRYVGNSFPVTISTVSGASVLENPTTGAIGTSYALPGLGSYGSRVMYIQNSAYWIIAN